MQHLITPTNFLYVSQGWKTQNKITEKNRSFTNCDVILTMGLWNPCILFFLKPLRNTEILHFIDSRDSSFANLSDFLFAPPLLKYSKGAIVNDFTLSSFRDEPKQWHQRKSLLFRGLSLFRQRWFMNRVIDEYYYEWALRFNISQDIKFLNWPHCCCVMGWIYMATVVWCRCFSFESHCVAKTNCDKPLV